MADRTFSLIEYYPATGIKTCPFCEVENPSTNSNCYICNTSLSIPYIAPDVVDEPKRTAPRPTTAPTPGPVAPYTPSVPAPEETKSPWAGLAIGIAIFVAIVIIASL